MSDDRSLTFLAKEDDSGKAIALLTAVVVLGLTFHAYSFFVIKNDEILNKYTEPVFSVTYQESSVQGSDSMLIAVADADWFHLLGVEDAVGVAVHADLDEHTALSTSVHGAAEGRRAGERAQALRSADRRPDRLRHWRHQRRPCGPASPGAPWSP